MTDMLWERILEALQAKGRTPNTFTNYLGAQLKKARTEAGMSQTELAERVYRRRPSISDMENGKMMPDIGTVVLLAVVLEKPLTYFVAPVYLRGSDANPEINEMEQELLLHFRHLNESQQKLALAQIRALTKHLFD